MPNPDPKAAHNKAESPKAVFKSLPRAVRKVVSEGETPKAFIRRLRLQRNAQNPIAP